MVKTSLVFFGTWTESRAGILRGSVSFFPILILLLIWNWFGVPAKNRSISRYVAMFVFALVLCSAIGVQQPTGNEDAVLYGALVGLCIALSCCSVQYLVAAENNDYFQFVMGLTVFTAALSLLTRYVSV